MNGEIGLIQQIEEKYSVGALLYAPATHRSIGQSIIDESFGRCYSVALCLEDTIAPSMVEQAETQLVETLRHIAQAQAAGKRFYLPKLFIRVREPAQLMRVFKKIGEWAYLVTGVIFPKYSVGNAPAYHEAFRALLDQQGRHLWMMPILESGDLVPPQHRSRVLGEIRGLVEEMDAYVLNIRVGGNDFSNCFAARRHYDETIYDIVPIAQILGDILAAFTDSYVVSGPVWEFFSSDNDEWAQGLRRELKCDRLCGFIGKTVIHPKQIPIVNEMLRVSEKDYADACRILNWEGGEVLVGRSFSGERMNEVPTHENWAKKITLLAKLYGVT